MFSATPSLVEAVEQTGFAIIPDVFPPASMDQLLEDLAQLPRSRAGIRHAMSRPSVAALAHDTSLSRMASAVLGDHASPYRATLFDKSHDSNWLVVWHQDTALPLAQKKEVAGWGPWSTKEGILYAHAPAKVLSKILALRVHLDHSAETNGPLRVLPGTHTHGVLTDDAIHALAETTSPFECTVQRGGVLAMRPLLIHASSKSQGNDPRRVLHIEYAAGQVVEGLTLAVA